MSFHAETEQGIFEEVLHGELDFDSDPWPSISEGAKDLVRRMLIRDPRKRLTAHEVLCELTQSFQSLPSYITQMKRVNHKSNRRKDNSLFRLSIEEI